MLREVGPWRILVPVRASLPEDVSLLVLDGPVAEAVWAALDGQCGGRELLDLVLARFEVDPAHARVELQAFLAQLLAVGAARPVR